MRPLLGAAPAGDIIQGKRDKIFKELPNVFGIADDIPVIGYDDDSTNHTECFERCNKSAERGDSIIKMSFQMYKHPLFQKINISVKADAHKLHALTEMPSSKQRKTSSHALGLNHLSKFSLATAEVCKPLS